MCMYFKHSFILDVESVTMATAKDRESTATSVATESTTEQSKVSQ